MLDTLTLSPQFEIHIVAGEGVLLISPSGDRVLCGRIFERVVPLLDGSTSKDGVVASLRRDFEPVAVHEAILELEEQGCLLATARSPMPTASNTATPRTTKAETPGAISLDVVPPLDAAIGARLGETLRALALETHDEGALRIVLTDNYLRPSLAAIDRDALRTARPWLLVKPVGPVAWIGPLFVPGSTGCWQCLRHRLVRNSPGTAYLVNHHPSQRGESIAAGVEGELAERALEWFSTGANHVLADAIITIDPITGAHRRHRFPRWPGCPHCGDPLPRADRPLHVAGLQSCPRADSTEGGYRGRSLTESLSRFESFADPLTGIVADLERIDDDVTPVYVATYPGRPRFGSLEALRNSRRRACGKGLSDVQARVSALGEAIERYCGLFVGDEPRIRAQRVDLPDAVDPNEWLSFSPSQFRNRERLNRGNPVRRHIPEPVAPKAELEWSPVWSLTHRRFRYLPTHLLYDEYPKEPAGFACAYDTNGCAAGSTMEDALLHGLLEVVERDGVAIWWYNKVRRPRVDLAGTGIAGLVEAHRRQGREFWALDLTNDLEIPIVAAVSRRVGHPTEEVLLGFGAHLDPIVALRRAITEMVQTVAVITRAQREGRRLSREMRHWLRHTTVASQPHLAPAAGPPSTLPADREAPGSSDIKDDVTRCKDRIERLGMEFMMLDQTRPEVGVPVVRAIVPGLRHFHRRFAPGRLYDVPVTLGWVERPRAERELNSVDLFY